MQDEIFTIGGGRFLYNFLSAVAAICQSTDFKGALNVALLASLIWVTILLAYRPADWGGFKTWFATCLIVIYGLLNITTTVKITDRLNLSGSAGYIVANVPIGVGKLASITSLIGDEMTRLMEANFADVNAPKLREHGMMFGVRLLANATRMEVKDSAFSNSLSNFIRQCLFYDIMLGRKNFDDLKTAKDPWAYITKEPALARMFMLETKTSTGTTKAIKTCAEGMATLNQRWVDETKHAMRRLALFSNPEALRTSARAGRWNEQRARIVTGHVQTDLRSFHQYLIGTSRASTDILKRQMTINAIINEPVDWNAETGNAAGLQSYIDARLALQTRQSYKGIKTQAEQWVPNMKAVFQCVAYAIFPFVLLLMLTPMGMAIIRNYIFTFLWIESWGPITAVMNYIVNSQAQNQMQAHVHAAGTGTASDIQLIAQSGIQAIEADISVMAGYLMMSVPFISLALVSIGRMAVLSQSILGPTQEAIGDTTRETATGNLSIGNTGHDNHNFHNYAGFNHATSSNWNSGQSTAMAPSGAPITQTGDGRWVVAGGTSQSAFATNVALGDQMSHAFSRAATHSDQVAETASNSLTETQSAMKGWGNDYANSISRGETSGLTYGTGETGSIREDFSTIRSAAQNYAKTHNLKEDDTIAGSLAASAAFKVFGMGPSAEAQYRATTNSSLSYEDALRFAQDEKVSTAFDRVLSANRTESAGEQNADTRSYNEKVNAAYNESQTLQSQISAAETRSQTLQTGATIAESLSSSINSSLSQPFFEWMQTQPSLRGDGNMSAREAEALLNSNSLADREIVTPMARSFLTSEAQNHVSDPDIKAAINALDIGQNYDKAANAVQGQANINKTMDGYVGDVPTGTGVRVLNQLEGARIKREATEHLDTTGKEVDAGKTNVEGRVDASASYFGEKAREQAVSKIPGAQPLQDHLDRDMGVESTRGVGMPDESDPGTSIKARGQSVSKIPGAQVLQDHLDRDMGVESTRGVGMPDESDHGTSMGQRGKFPREDQS